MATMTLTQRGRHVLAHLPAQLNSPSFVTRVYMILLRMKTESSSERERNGSQDQQVY